MTPQTLQRPTHPFNRLPEISREDFDAATLQVVTQYEPVKAAFKAAKDKSDERPVPVKRTIFRRAMRKHTRHFVAAQPHLARYIGIIRGCPFSYVHWNLLNPTIKVWMAFERHFGHLRQVSEAEIRAMEMVIKGREGKLLSPKLRPKLWLAGIFEANFNSCGPFYNPKWLIATFWTVLACFCAAIERPHTASNANGGERHE